MQEGELVKQLPCQHMYHAPCIDQWLVVSKVSPLLVDAKMSHVRDIHATDVSRLCMWVY